MSVCAITGATGYIGSALSSRFRTDGWRVISMTRRPEHIDGESVPFVLGEPVEPTVFEGVDLLIHCAWDFSPRRWPEIRRIDIEGTRRLLLAARAAEVKCVMLFSTMSAFPRCISLYGKAKLECERIADECGAVIVRPGLVYGEPNGGLFGAIEAMVWQLPIVPVIGGGRQMLFTCNVQDLGALVAEIAESGPAPGGPIMAAHPDPWTMRTLVAAISRGHGSRRLIFQIPWQAPWLFLRSLETLGFDGAFRSDSVLGLVRPNPDPDFSTLAPFSTRFRPYAP